MESEEAGGRGLGQLRAEGGEEGGRWQAPRLSAFAGGARRGRQWLWTFPVYWPTGLNKSGLSGLSDSDYTLRLSALPLGDRHLRRAAPGAVSSGGTHLSGRVRRAPSTWAVSSAPGGGAPCSWPFCEKPCACPGPLLALASLPSSSDRRRASPSEAPFCGPQCPWAALGFGAAPGCLSSRTCGS